MFLKGLLVRSVEAGGGTFHENGIPALGANTPPPFPGPQARQALFLNGCRHTFRFVSEGRPLSPPSRGLLHGVRRGCAQSSSRGSWSAPSKWKGGLFTRTVLQLWARGWASLPFRCRFIYINTHMHIYICV